MESKRNINFELMRILSMLFIIFWHITIWGNVFDNCKKTSIFLFLTFISYVIGIHVNSFVLLSGFFQSKSRVKISKIIKFLLQVLFYLIFCFIIAYKCGWISNCTIVDFINIILPSGIHKYWFITCYLITYAFSDYLNFFISKMSHSQYKNFLILSFIIISIIPFLSGYKVIGNPSYTFYFFIFLYFIGAYLRLYEIRYSYHFRNMSTNGYRMLLILVFFSMAITNFLINFYSVNTSNISNIFTEISKRLYAVRIREGYASPLVIVQSIAYFEFFKSLKVDSPKKISNFILNISGCVFGVYLLHENYLIRPYIYTILKIDTGPFWGYSHLIRIFAGLLIIFIFGIIVEMFRQLLFKLILKINYVKKVIKKIKLFITSFKFDLYW